jgi:hypothetical protein
MLAREDRLSPQELADLLDLSAATLAGWRSRDHGPPYMSVGRKIWYPRAKAEAWLETRLQLQRTKDDDAPQSTGNMALPIQGRRKRMQRHHAFGRPQTKRDASEEHGGRAQTGTSRGAQSEAPCHDEALL